MLESLRRMLVKIVGLGSSVSSSWVSRLDECVGLYEGPASSGDSSSANAVHMSHCLRYNNKSRENDLA